MNTILDDRRLAELADAVAPRSLGGRLAASPQLDQVRATSSDSIGARHVSASVRGRALNAVTVPAGFGGTTSAVLSPVAHRPGVLDVVATVDATDAVVVPFTMSVTDAADEVDTGDAADESSIVFTHGTPTPLPTLAHQMPVDKRTLRHSAMLAGMVDRVLLNGLRARVRASVVDTLVADATIPTFPGSVREAIAAAADAFPELGDGPVTVLLSGELHAAIDEVFGAANVRAWPARLIDTPGLTDGTVFVGRFGQAVLLHLGAITVGAGHVDDQFVKNKLSLLGFVEALPSIVAPTAIVKIEGEDLS